MASQQGQPVTLLHRGHRAQGRLEEPHAEGGRDPGERQLLQRQRPPRLFQPHVQLLWQRWQEWRVAASVRSVLRHRLRELGGQRDADGARSGRGQTRRQNEPRISTGGLGLGGELQPQIVFRPQRGEAEQKQR